MSFSKRNLTRNSMIQSHLKKYLPVKTVNYLRRMKHLFRTNKASLFELDSAFLEKEPELAHLLLRLDRDAVCIDVGGNVGNFSWHLCRHCTAGKIIAFEPRSDLFRALLRNLARFSNFEARRNAVSSNPGFVEVSLDPSHGNSMVKDGPNTAGLKTEEVEAITLDSFISGNNISRLDFLKVDVEGHEEKVFQGAGETLKHLRPMILCESENRHLRPMGNSVENLIRFITTTFGYQCFYLQHGKLKPYSEDIVPASKSGESVYIYNWFLVPSENTHSFLMESVHA